MRIVSLLPSATEIVCELGLGDQLIGVTHECDYPEFVKQLPKVTQTLIPHDAASRKIDELVRERLATHKALYSLNMSALEELQPDLFVTQALCDVCAVAEEEVMAAACALPGQPKVVNLEPMRLDEVFECIQLVGDAAQVPERARSVIDSLQARVDAVKERSAEIEHIPTVVLLEWIAPPFCCGHWSPELIEFAGGQEKIGHAWMESRTTAWDEILQSNPEYLFIACCGFSVERTMQDLPVLRSFPGFGDLACVRSQNVFVIDGNAYFSRPGPRLVDGLEILAHALHPCVHPLPSGLAPARRLTRDELAVPST